MAEENQTWKLFGMLLVESSLMVIVDDDIESLTCDSVEQHFRGSEKY